MAFQAPIAARNVMSASSELSPTMSSALRASCQGVARQSPFGALRQYHTAPRNAAGPISEARPLPSRFTSRQAPLREVSRSKPTTTGAVSAGALHALGLRNTMATCMPLTSFMARHFSSSSRSSPPSKLRQLPQSGPVGLSLIQQRSLFGAPSRNTLARLEQSANRSPESAAAQANFYSALLRANMPQIIVERHGTGHFATNTVVERLYRQAEDKVGTAGSHDHQTANFSPDQMQAIGQAVGAHAGKGQVGKMRAGAGFKNDPLYVVIEESMWTHIFKWVRWLLAFGLCVYIALVLITLFVETSGVLKKVGGGTNAEVHPEHQKTRFTDVHGCDEAKEELNDVVDFLKNPDRYNKLGGRLPKGVLLVGPPGTGKTLLARAVAGEAGVPFFYMSGSEFDEVYVGVGAKRVRELFNNARSKAPAIVFIDELDAIGGKRQSRDANYHRQTLNQLLNDLDGFDQSTGLIFIAATNHPEILDKALLRPGRFDRHVQVELPDVKGRLAILKHHTKKIRLNPEVDLSGIARGTPGFSGAELENLANTAAIQASKHHAKFVSLPELEWAKDKIMMGSERKNRIVPLADKVQTAYHEGGHTLVGLYTKGFSEVHKASILPRGYSSGVTYFLPDEEHHRSRQQYIRQLQVCMGGKIAEEIVFGADNVGDGASSDIQQATRLAYAMVTSYGFSDLLGSVDFSSNYDQVSGETKRLIDNEVRRLIDEAKDDAKSLLSKHRKELDHLAEALVQYETLDRDEIKKVIQGEKLPNRLMAMPGTEIKVPSIKAPPAVAPPVRGSDNDSGPPGSGVPA